MAAAAKQERINLRASPEQSALFRMAADATGRNLTDFMLDSAAIEARRVLAERTFFGVEAETWDRFTEILDRPATVKPRLRELMRTPSVLEQ